MELHAGTDVAGHCGQANTKRSALKGLLLRETVPDRVLATPRLCRVYEVDGPVHRRRHFA